MMHKRLVLYLLLSIITFFSNVYGAESEGMPQLNPEFWVSQIFWLILTFGFLLIILSKFILPKISNNLELRKSQILENIETAEKQKMESENKIKEYETLINNSKNEARNYFNEARKKILFDIDKKKRATRTRD
jgi:F-type H+-transporting ATPase subunit b